ncbi:MAG: MFS transporter, partial [Candidatus Lokiarchaeota archaeon]
MSETNELIKREITLKGTGIEDKEKDLDRWRSNIWKFYLFSIFMGFHMISGVLIPFFTQWGNLSFVEIMLLQSYFTIMILIFEIPCGAIADYISRKSSLILGAVANISAAIVYGMIPNIGLFIIGETLWAFSSALISGTDQAFLYDSLRKLNRDSEISKIMARRRSFFLIGMTFAAPVGSFIGQCISLPLTMLGMTIPFTVATIISLTFHEPNHDLEPRDFFLFWTYQIYLQALGVPLIFYGFVASSMTIIQIIFNNLASRIGKVKHKTIYLRIFTLVPGIAYILMALIYFSPISIALILLLIGFGFSRSIIFIKGINEQIKTRNRATVLSTINMFGSLLMAILYPVIGSLVTMNLSFTFIITGIIVILFGVITKLKNENFK